MSQIFNIYQISFSCVILCNLGRGKVRNIKFESNFQRSSNFFILPNFLFWRTVMVKNLKPWVKCSMLLKYFDFATLMVCRVGQKSAIWDTLSTLLEYLDFAKFHVLQDQGCPKSQIWVKFSTLLKLPHFAKFYVLQDWGGQKSKISNFWCDSNLFILPNFMVWWSAVVKNVEFECPIFNTTQMSSFAIFMFPRSGKSKSSF